MEQICVVGAGVMGSNIARNMARHGFKVAVYDHFWEKTQKLLDLKEPGITGYKTIKEAVEALKPPRILLLLVNAEFVDDVINDLKGLLKPDDMIIDGGNSHWKDTERRQKAIEPTGIHFVGMGISGGEKGALEGPSMMFGGHKQDWENCKPILLEIAAKAADGTPCVDYMGERGAGHFVKMVHNAIEYSDMQLIAETYHILKNLFKYDNEKCADTFGQWNKGPLKSYLIEISEKVLRKKEENEYVIDLILDCAGQKGTGKWASQDAFDIGSPTPAFQEAVDARIISSLKEERVFAAKTINKNPITDIPIHITVDDLENALYAAKLISYAQGLALIQKASQEFNYNIDIAACARIWRGGCIIRADFLNDVSSNYTNETKNLLLIPYFKNIIESKIQSLRKINALCSLSGYPIPLYSSTLSYFDAYSSECLPANMLQGLRDFFGAHTYERIDKPGHFHTEWE